MLFLTLQVHDQKQQQKKRLIVCQNLNNVKNNVEN